MAFSSWRGVVGCIKPTLRPGGLEELIRMLPDGIGVLPLFLNISKGTTDEFKRAVTPYEPLVQQLADHVRVRAAVLSRSIADSARDDRSRHGGRS